ncbi:hypothetical protein TNCV_990761 [Trichonephila clavipes]|nr:hypothetical protein TNCV_990761 [Trichonephila clavipes]
MENLEVDSWLQWLLSLIITLLLCMDKQFLGKQTTAQTPSRDWCLCPVSSLVCLFHCIQQKRLQSKTSESKKTEGIFFSEISRDSQYKVLLIESSSTEKVELISFHLYYKLDRFGGEGIYVRDSIIL